MFLNQTHIRLLMNWLTEKRGGLWEYIGTVLSVSAAAILNNWLVLRRLGPFCFNLCEHDDFRGKCYAVKIAYWSFSSDTALGGQFGCIIYFSRVRISMFTNVRNKDDGFHCNTLHPLLAPHTWCIYLIAMVHTFSQCCIPGAIKTCELRCRRMRQPSSSCRVDLGQGHDCWCRRCWDKDRRPSPAISQRKKRKSM